MDPIEFCPAAAAARALARLEAKTDVVDDMIARTVNRHPDACAILSDLDEVKSALIEETDHARTRLARETPVSAAGAIAQLLAAIHDLRVGDDAERIRARLLEAHVVEFLATAGLSAPADARRLSRTPQKPPSIAYPASFAISSSEMS